MENQHINYDYIDIARALGIILIVIGHSSSPIGKFIYLFHVSLFFFLSGFLYKDKYSNDIKLFIKKKIIALYVPFIEFMLLFLCIHNLLYKFNVYSNAYKNIDFFKSFIKILAFGNTEQLGGALWFLRCLFTVNIMFCIISYISKKYFAKINFFKPVCIIFNFLVGISTGVLKIKNFWTLGTSLVCLLFFYIGYLYKKHEAKVKMKLYYAIGCFIILLFCSYFVKVDLVSNTYNYPLLMLINAVLGFYFIIYMSKCLASYMKCAKLFKWIGKNTKSIMALHLTSFKVISLIIIIVYHYSYNMLSRFPVINGKNEWWLLYSLTGIMIPLLISYIYSKLKGSFKSRSLFLLIHK